MIFEQVTPFGNHNLLLSDMGSQYITFFSSLHHSLFTHSFQFYSFSQSLGANFFPTVAYYLISPFNLLFLLFPNTADIPKAVTLIIILKSSTIAFTMTYFLEKHFKKQDPWLALFGTIFSLCGFVALNYFNIMWLDALICLPLVINGIDDLVSTGRTKKFFGWLFVSILTNFYLGYMICLFSVFYIVYILIETRSSLFPIQNFWKMNRSILTKFFASEFLCALSTSFLLLPTVLGMLQTAKGGSWKNFTLAPQFGLEVLSQLGVGASNYSSRLFHAPSIFSTTFVILLTLCYFVHPQIKKTSKRNAACFLIIFLSSMLIKLSNTIWHLGQQPAGFPFRNSFFVSFILIVFAYQAWEKNPLRISRFWKWMLPSMLIGTITAGYFGSRLSSWILHNYFSRSLRSYQVIHVTSLKSVILSFLFVAATSILIFSTKKMYKKVLLLIVVLFEITCNFLLAMDNTPFGNQAVYKKNFTYESSKINQINGSTNCLFRVNNSNTLINKAYHEKYYNYNDPMLFNFYGINFYSSTLNNTTRKTLHAFGFFSKNVRRISSIGLTPLTEFLFGVKYSFELNNKQQDIAPNPSFVGIGFAVPTAFNQLKLSTGKKFSSISNQELVLQALKKSKEPYFEKSKILSSPKTGKVISSSKYGYTYIVKTKASGPMYSEWSAKYSRYKAIYINGKKLSIDEDVSQHKYLQYLGTFSKNQKVKINFVAKKNNLKDNLRIYSLKNTKFKKIVTHTRKSSFSPKISTSFLHTQVTGTIKTTDSSKLLYLSIPYDKGWTILRNDRKVPVKRSLKGMMSVKLIHGYNKIVLTYHVPGLKIGSILSVFSFIFYCLLEFFWTCRRRHSLNKKASHINRN